METTRYELFQNQSAYPNICAPMTRHFCGRSIGNKSHARHWIRIDKKCPTAAMFATVGRESS